MATAALQRIGDAGQTARWRRAQKFVRRLWRGIRDWCGDSAYERYVSAAHRASSPQCALLTEKQFYVEQLDRRYSRPNRCC
jgi:uncharacterized short protein YbdD (DUF466 family)